jgi:hypothetical protein
MGRSPRERRERVKPVDLTQNKMPYRAVRHIDPDQTRKDSQSVQATACSRASASSLPSAARVKSMPGLAVLPVNAARNGCAT